MALDRDLAAPVLALRLDGLLCWKQARHIRVRGAVGHAVTARLALAVLPAPSRREHAPNGLADDEPSVQPGAPLQGLHQPSVWLAYVADALVTALTLCARSVAPALRALASLHFGND